jgi:biotin operon repressor
MKLGKWDVEIDFEADVKEWVARLRFDTGCIIERSPRRWEALANLRDHWEALRITGEFN